MIPLRRLCALHTNAIHRGIQEPPENVPVQIVQDHTTTFSARGDISTHIDATAFCAPEHVSTQPMAALQRVHQNTTVLEYHTPRHAIPTPKGATTLSDDTAHTVSKNVSGDEPSGKWAWQDIKMHMPQIRSMLSVEDKYKTNIVKAFAHTRDIKNSITVQGDAFCAFGMFFTVEPHLHKVYKDGAVTRDLPIIMTHSERYTSLYRSYLMKIVPPCMHLIVEGKLSMLKQNPMPDTTDYVTCKQWDELYHLRDAFRNDTDVYVDAPPLLVRMLNSLFPDREASVDYVIRFYELKRSALVEELFSAFEPIYTQESVMRKSTEACEQLETLIQQPETGRGASAEEKQLMEGRLALYRTELKTHEGVIAACRESIGNMELLLREKAQAVRAYDALAFFNLDEARSLYFKKGARWIAPEFTERMQHMNIKETVPECKTTPIWNQRRSEDKGDDNERRVLEGEMQRARMRGTKTLIITDPVPTCSGTVMPFFAGIKLRVDNWDFEPRPHWMCSEPYYDATFLSLTFGATDTSYIINTNLSLFHRLEHLICTSSVPNTNTRIILSKELKTHLRLDLRNIQTAVVHKGNKETQFDTDANIPGRRCVITLQPETMQILGRENTNVYEEPIVPSAHAEEEEKEQHEHRIVGPVIHGLDEEPEVGLDGSGLFLFGAL